MVALDDRLKVTLCLQFIFITKVPHIVILYTSNLGFSQFSKDSLVGTINNLLGNIT